MSWLKKWLPKKRRTRVELYVVSTLLVAAAADMGLVQYWRRIEVSPETTRVIAPLDEVGMPDYITALNEKYGKGVTEENNAAGLLLKAKSGTSSLLTSEAESNALVPVVTNFPLWVSDSANKVGLPNEQEVDDQFAAMRQSLWKGAEHPIWARWLESQAKALADARLGVQRPRLYVPLVPRQMRPGDVGMLFRYDRQVLLTYNLHTIGWALEAEAMRRAGEGDMVGFREDIVAVMKLARLMGQGPTGFHAMVEYALEASAMREVRAVLLAPGSLSREECRRLLAELEDPGPKADLAAVVDCQMRWEVLDGLSAIAYEGLGAYDARYRMEEDQVVLGLYFPAWCFKAAFLFVPVHYNVQLRHVNAAVDEYVAALRLPTFTARRAALRALDRRYNHRVDLLTETDRLYHMPLSEIMLEGICAIEVKTRVEVDLARVALALAVYRGERGGYPEKLEELKAGGILREVPLDGFSDKPLVYERRGGGYVLYSVGDKTFGDNGEGEVQQGRGGYAWRVVKVE